MSFTSNVLLQATAPACVARVAPRGRILAAGFDDGLLALWGYEPAVRELKRVPTGDVVADVIFSPRLSLLITVGREHLRGWRVPDLGETFAWHVGPIEGAQFAADGNTAVVASGGRLREVDLRDGHLVRTSAPLGDRLVGLRTYRDDLLALTDGGLLRIAPQTLTAIATTPLEGAPRGFSMAPDGARCALVDDGGVRVIALGEGAPLVLGDVVAPCEPVWSAEGRLLAAGGGDGRIVVVDTVRSQVLHTLEGHDGAVRCLALLHGQGTLASAGHDGTVRTWDLRRSRR